MPSFGISSFLKIIHLNEKPQKTEVRGRFKPKKSAYDFHRSVRTLCTDLAVNNSDIELIVNKLRLIKKDSERNSAGIGLKAFIKWKKQIASNFAPANGVTFESPKGNFQVKFSPNFSLVDGAQVTTVHIWNTTKPPLNDHLVRAVLSVFPDLYKENKPDDIAVLCLRSQRLIRLGQPDAKIKELGILLVNKIDRIITDIKESDDGISPDTGDHPAPSPFH